MVHKTYINSLQYSFPSNARVIRIFREVMSNDFATIFPSKEILYILRSFPNCLDDLNAPDWVSATHVLQLWKPLFCALRSLDLSPVFLWAWTLWPNKTISSLRNLNKTLLQRTLLKSNLVQATSPQNERSNHRFETLLRMLCTTIISIGLLLWYWITISLDWPLCWN